MGFTIHVQVKCMTNKVQGVLIKVNYHKMLIHEIVWHHLIVDCDGLNVHTKTPKSLK